MSRPFASDKTLYPGVSAVSVALSRSSLSAVTQTPPSWTDEELLDALRRGDRRAALALYEHLRPVIDRSLRRVLHGRHRDFDDLMQMTFERILRGVAEDRFAGRSSLRTWASAIAAHVALDALRTRGREARRLQEDVPLAELPGGPRGESRLEARAELHRVHDILSRMNPDLAETLLLHDVLGHPLDEIAEMKRAGLSATQSRLRRARLELKRRAAATIPPGGRYGGA